MATETPPAPQKQRRPLPRWLRWLLEGLLFLALFWGITWYQSRDALAVGSTFPRDTLQTADGATWSWDSLAGKPVLIHVWATWCGVCRREFSTLEALAAAPPEGTTVVSVVADGTDSTQLDAFVKAKGINYPVLLGDDHLIQQLGVTAYPTNFYLSADGKVQSVTVGMSTRWGMWLRLWWLR
jgi:thiol-disulfide isomerase/thioredoxin